MFIWGRRSKSIFVKFSASFLLVGLIPLFALSYISVQTFSGYVERYTTSNLQQMVLYMSYNLNSAFNQYNEVSKLMYTGRYEGFIESYSQNQTYNVNELEQINTIPIETFLKTVLYSDSYITSVYFHRESDDKLYYQEKENRGVNFDLLPYQEWLTKMAPNPSQVAIFPTHSEEYYTGSKRSVFTIGRTLIDISGRVTKDPKIVGTLFMDVDVSLFNQFFRELNLGGQDELFLLDGDGNVYFTNETRSANGEAFRAKKDEEMIVLSEEIPFLKGTVTARIHRENLFDQLFSARTTVFIAMFICAIAMIIMGVWFSRRLAAPIRNLIKQMAIVESGNLDTQMVVNSNDEMGRLSHGFNRMVERLQAYIDEAYVAQIKQKQTELNALKSQIRPHYLYNTLEVIRMNAVDKDNDEVADMILSLSNQLKYVIDYGEDRVSIRQELEHLRDYFYIISVRYENKFELVVDLSPEVDLNWYILKLSLQPIVENAIQHGLRSQGRGTVGLTIEKKDEMLLVTIYDDGIGMSKEKVQQLAETLEEPSSPSKNVGLKNVHERIRTVYGAEYGVSISSREHIGTSILLLLPIVEDPYKISDSENA
ncbi:cache domain-containing sensor histidine kinase [Paenibacillus odorifer]|uniref:cache domain-containing sensor histidine kinase n=1 Tax=Paenibacillus odorifer TaxID=189426 RepID=UPI0009701FC4|nr:sensor histidine kinase [Paenibacillus odorifer]OMD97350.1 two-component sensor histidine kinase [Paenibacillus odorifer]